MHRGGPSRSSAQNCPVSRYKHGCRSLRESLSAPLPSFHRGTGMQHPCRLDGAVKRNPGHYLGIGEVFPPSARFPNTLVRLLPDGFEMLDQAAKHGKRYAPRLFPAGLAPYKTRPSPRHRYPIATALTPHSLCELAWSLHIRKARLIRVPADSADRQGLHDLDLIGTAGDGAQQPLLPGFGSW